jgi:membrane protease YdiL (CAAX protease family)
MSSVAPPPSWPAPPDPPELPEGAEPTDVVPPWRWWQGVVGFVTWFVGVNVVATIIILAVSGTSGADDPPPGATIAATVVQDVLLVVAAVVFAKFASAGRPVKAWHFGLRMPERLWPAVGWLAVTYVSFVMFSLAWVSALGIDEKDDLPKELGVEDSHTALVFTAILVTVIAPIAEEFFFRGFLFRALRGSAGLWWGAIITGIVFGGIHLGSSPIGFIVPLMVFGFALCLLYAQTGSLYVPIALHAINNSIAFGVGVGWDWQIVLLVPGALATIASIGLIARRWTGDPSPHLSPV